MATCTGPDSQETLDVSGAAEATWSSTPHASPSLSSTDSLPSPASSTDSVPNPDLTILERNIDDPRTLRVIVIGGGITGVTAGILLPAKVPNIELTIYEKNRDFGGTWLENTYPGVRCDVPSHVYQSTFAPNVEWSDKFSSGAEIRDYWQSTARKYDVYKYAVFGRRVEDLSWNPVEAVWNVTVRNIDTGDVETATADFVVTATGRFNAWRLPEFAGRSDYRGVLRHASNWDGDFDLAGKRVAVIGNGASGIQLVANIQKTVGHLDHYARNKTWIATSLTGEDRTVEPQPIPEALKETFRADPQAYLKFRKEIEDRNWRRFKTFFRDSDENKKMKEAFVDIMKRRLAKKPELIDELIPDFSPNCRRLTPGPGYLEALTEDNVEYIRTPIRRLTETGIETEDGRHREVDAIFCATGANVDMIPSYSIRAGGRNLREDWAPGGKPGFPKTYLGNAAPGFPNLLFVHGPNSSGPSGSLPHSVESQVTFVAKVLRKVSHEGIKTIVPSDKAADDFTAFIDSFFKKTVLTEACSSWYNGGRVGNRIVALWPGSSSHAALVRQNPRWEDWEYEYLSGSGNRFLWYFGNGITKRETDPNADMTSYLQVADDVDLRAVHELWWV
ncbi:flavin-binding monooxygenase [Grosmannia clavigera kw1407]|uniref:Flavin-binding monooxygenase n=1 Tax=Grosmannia clavigera (strain kw1407 / UAMH 11150) TaxID=655863 RepID=F0X734_GROCL|nr:flavin-binding monooxygenase [Grosmannia clavigera kw1407]EFX06597.1 flavin-binding monooxygenase [Grosmannia clavigera kw1407]